MRSGGGCVRGVVIDAHATLSERLSASDRPEHAIQQALGEARAASQAEPASSASALAERAFVVVITRAAAGNASLAGDTEWSRDIRAWLPVRDPDFWEQQRPAIEGIWGDLTGDQLQLRFEQDDAPADPPRQSRDPLPDHDCVALLSGGQDSIVGALALLDTGRQPLLLSHSASGAVNAAQNAVEAILRARDPQLKRVKLGAGKARDRPFPGLESSQRGRTFLFVGAAAVLAALGGSERSC